LLLYLADRDQHLSEVVRPALDRGEIVITDRFSDSTIAYQGCARRLDLPMVVRLDDIVRRGLSPHLTVLLDCPVSVGLGRARGNDRFHQEDGDFHGRVRQGLLAQAERAPARYAVIDAAQPAATVEKEVLAAVLRCVEGR
jgi:dTMP kinase